MRKRNRMKQIERKSEKERDIEGEIKRVKNERNKRVERKGNKGKREIKRVKESVCETREPYECKSQSE